VYMHIVNLDVICLVHSDLVDSDIIIPLAHLASAYVNMLPGVSNTSRQRAQLCTVSRNGKVNRETVSFLLNEQTVSIEDIQVEKEELPIQVIYNRSRL